MFLGSIMLFQEVPGFKFRVDWRVALAVALTTGLFFVFALGMALRARLRKPTTGREGLIGEKGVAVTNIDPEGDILAEGSSDQWEVVMAKVDLDEVHKAQKALPFWRDRRPSEYRPGR